MSSPNATMGFGRNSERLDSRSDSQSYLRPKAHFPLEHLEWHVYLCLQTLSQLLERSSDTKFAHWAATFAYLHATTSDPPLTKEHRLSYLLKAEAHLFTKTAYPFESPETLLVYIAILRALANLDLDTYAGKRQEALRILTPDIKPVFEESTVASVPKAKEGVSSEEKKEVFNQQIAFERSFVRRQMGDLRFKWLRWEILEEWLLSESKKDGAQETHDDLAVTWDWQKELERLDDSLRGAEDVP